MNLKKLLLGSVLAGTGMFMWGNVSWMMLNWHQPRSLKNEDAVKAAIKAGATEHGLYLLPGHLKSDGTHREMDECQKLMEEGPLMYAMIRPGSTDRSMTSYMIGGLLGQIFLALLLGVILSRVPLGPSCLVKLSCMIGLLGALIQWLPNWNWWSWPPMDWLPYVADSVVTCGIAGFILSKFVAKPGATCPS
jgi:hypothetical protein